MARTRGPLFPLGMLVLTPGAEDALAAAHADAATYLRRHMRGDWGDLDAHDTRENERAVRGGGRLLSAYRLPDDAQIWVITERDRSVTTLLLPDEY